jgi:hypothetical protein
MKLSLREWLGSGAGLKGKKLEAALGIVDDEIIGSFVHHPIFHFGLESC